RGSRVPQRPREAARQREACARRPDAGAPRTVHYRVVAGRRKVTRRSARDVLTSLPPNPPAASDRAQNDEQHDGRADRIEQCVPDALPEAPVDKRPPDETRGHAYRRPREPAGTHCTAQRNAEYDRRDERHEWNGG